MKTREEKEIIRTIVTEITCDCCGDAWVVDDGYYDENINISNIKLAFGYGSKFDQGSFGEPDLDIDICDDCLELWFRTFKHKPYILENE